MRTLLLTVAILCFLSEETSRASCSAYSLTSFPLLQFPEASAWEKSPVSIDDWPVMAVLLPSRLHPGSTTQLFFPLESPTYQTGPTWAETNTRKNSIQVIGARQENHGVSWPTLKVIINKCKRPLLLQRRSYHTGACRHTHASENDCVHVKKDGHAGLGAHVGKDLCVGMGVHPCTYFQCMWPWKVENAAVCTECLWGGSLRQWAASSNCSSYSSSFTSLLWSWHQRSLLKKKKRLLFWNLMKSAVIAVWLNEFQLSGGTNETCVRFRDALGNSIIRCKGNPPPIQGANDHTVNRLFLDTCICCC